ncbi:MAG: hypothetical protein MZV63_64445 [Marinilabiliales bacterium]|nr:hypothetical protein [Marinilabiliales bacterium]
MRHAIMWRLVGWHSTLQIHQTGGLIGMATLKEKFYAEGGPDAGPGPRPWPRTTRTVNVSKVDVGQVVGGARDIISMLWDVSLLDKFEGIRFRGYSIPELRDKLPKAPGGTEPLPEGIFYLLLLGEIPTYEDCVAVTEEWQKRSVLPQYLIDVAERRPQGHAPDDPVLAGHPAAPEGLGVRPPLQREDAQDPVLGRRCSRTS